MVQKTVVLPQSQSIACRRHFLSFRRGRSSWSRLFNRPQRFLSCCSISGSRCPGCAGRAGSFHRRGSEAVPHGPDLPSDHCLFPVAEHGGRCPCCATSHVSVCSAMLGLLCYMLCVSLRCIGYFLRPLYLTVTCSEFATGVHDYGFFWEMASWFISVFSSCWFNTGYMFTSVKHAGSSFAAAVLLRGRPHPCRCAESIPWSTQFVTHGIPQLLYKVVDVPVVQVVQVHFPVVAQRESPWSFDHGHSQLQYTMADVPVVHFVQVHFPVGAPRQSPWSKLFV